MLKSIWLEVTCGLKFEKSINQSFETLIKMNLENYTGILFVDLDRKLYQYSETIKYLTYKELNIPLITDYYHRIARMYSYLYPDKVFFHWKNHHQRHSSYLGKVSRARKRLLKLQKLVQGALNEYRND